MLKVLLVAMLLVPALAYAQIPTAVSEATLAIVMAGSITGALLRNFIGYRNEKKVNSELTYDFGELVKTIIFSIFLGMATMGSLTTLLEVDVSDSVVKAVLLYGITAWSVWGMSHASKELTRIE